MSCATRSSRPHAAEMLRQLWRRVAHHFVSLAMMGLTAGACLGEEERGR